MEASRLQVAERVVLAGERRDARAIMAVADAVVLGSEQEGLPLVVLEAQAAGTPVVVGDTPGIRDVVQDRMSGLAVPLEEGAMAEGIHRVLQDAELAGSLAAGGIAAAVGYSEQDMIDRFLALYGTLVTR